MCKSGTVLDMGKTVFTYCYKVVPGVNVSNEKDREKVSPLYGLHTTKS